MATGSGGLEVCRRGRVCSARPSLRTRNSPSTCGSRGGMRSASLLVVLCFFQGPVLGRADVAWKASFASAFTTHAVLQRAPARPIVYGVCTSDAQHASEGRSSTANISIQVEVQSIESGANYIVGPSQVHWLNGSYVRWSASLRPGQPQDGAHTISVACGAMQSRRECSLLGVSCR